MRVGVAVGQRVTALHPKERHLFTGTVLTPDGNHYRIQFDRQKHGVQLVRDLFVDAPCTCIKFTPSKALSASYNEADEQKIEQTKQRLGEEGTVPSLCLPSICLFVLIVLSSF